MLRSSVIIYNLYVSNPPYFSSNYMFYGPEIVCVVTLYLQDWGHSAEGNSTFPISHNLTCAQVLVSKHYYVFSLPLNK